MAVLPSAIALVVGTIATAISTQLVQFPDTLQAGILMGCIGVACLAVSPYLAAQGYKLE